MDINRSYDTSRHFTESNTIFTFISNGKAKIIKTIEYSLIGMIKKHPVFNLGFGDYNIVSDTVSDEIVSNNGDVYRVFNTILVSAKAFLEENPNAIIMIRGSDSSEDFIEKCKLSCKQHCLVRCKKKDRRISIYRTYINKNFIRLTSDYSLFGNFFLDANDFTMENYRIGAEYFSLFIMKKSKFTV